MFDVPVLIVGGGPVGLTASILLSHHGVRSLLVERHPGTAILPKAVKILGVSAWEASALVARENPALYSESESHPSPARCWRVMRCPKEIRA